MKALHLAAIAVGLAIAGGFAWWGAAGTRGSGTVAKDPGRVPPLTGLDVRSASEPIGVAPATIEAVVPAPQGIDRLAIVEARFVDAKGAPRSGVRLAPLAAKGLPRWDPGEGERSDSDGHVRLCIALPEVRPLSAGDVELELVASRDGCATLARTASLRVGETTPLGEIVLGPGVRIRGRTLDGAGKGVRNATIGTAPAELSGDEGRMRRHGSDSFSRVPCAFSDDSGAFVLDGVVPGTLRIWGHAAGQGHAWSAPIVASEEGDVGDLRLVLTPLLATDSIEGRAVGPDGNSLPHAEVTFREHSRGSSSTGSLRANVQGAFRLLVLHDDSTYDLTAHDVKDHFESGTLEGVLPGARHVEIQLQPKRWFTVRVRDPAGEPIVDARLFIQSFVHREIAAEQPAPGDYILPLPVQKFSVAVDADGYRVTRLGRGRDFLDPAVLPAVIEAVLQPAPLVHGIVTAGGAPVAGAKVRLLRDIPNATWTVSGYRARYVVPGYFEGAITDEHGRYRIDCDLDGGFWLHVTAAGWVAGEVGPLNSANIGMDCERDVELTRGGAIEGTVLLPGGRDAVGAIVALNHGDGLPRTVRAGPGGRFHVEGLAPGPWQVLPALSEILPERSVSSSIKADAPIEWSCEVRAGETARFDLDLSKPY